MITVTCPECLVAHQVPDEAEGSVGTCMDCGATVEVPIVNKKTCAACEKDITREKRAKDPAGNYYCVTCFKTSDKARAAFAGMGPAVCSFCGFTMDWEELLSNGGRPACRSCFTKMMANRAKVPLNEGKSKPATPVVGECPICKRTVLYASMLDTGGRRLCKTCYLSAFAGRDPKVVHDPPVKLNPIVEVVKPTFWSKVSGAFRKGSDEKKG